MTLGLGKTSKDACVCTPGYTGGTDSVVETMQTYSSTACARFLTLTSKPSFATVSTRNNVGVGSDLLPTYNPTGGPNGKGHIEFRYRMFFDMNTWEFVSTPLQYFDAGSQNFNIDTNGGFTLVVVARALERYNADKMSQTIFEAMSARNLIDLSRTESGRGIRAMLRDIQYNEKLEVVVNVVDWTKWMYIVVRFDGNMRKLSMSINSVMYTNEWDPENDARVIDNSFAVMVGSSKFGQLTTWTFDGDMAGVFFVDEVLSNSAVTAITSQMAKGVDLTIMCDGGSSGECTGCSAGKFKVDPGPAQCTNCGVHKYSTAVAATSEAVCTKCPTNTGSAIGSDMLLSCTCNIGYTGDDGHECSACVAGQYKTATGSASCTNCELGKYSALIAASQSATCQSCPANSWTDLPGMTTIADCRCNAGYTGSDGDCIACVAGKYKVISGSASCTSCGLDKYSTALAATSQATCIDCPAFSQAPEGSRVRTACICNIGYTGPGGSHAPGITACEACVKGTFKDTTGSEACTNCLANTYSTAVAAVSVSTCVECAANMQSDVGSDQSIDCKCNKGYTGQDGMTCSACEAGTFKDSVGAATCENCAKDTYSTKEANPANDCDSCPSHSQSPAGSNELVDCQCNAGYSGQDGQTCTACDPGQYKPEVGAAVCSFCPENHYQPDAAQTALSDCKTCGPNSLSSIGNALQASCQCAPGYTGENGKTCEACYMGKFKRNKGSQDCELCPKMTYSGEMAQISIVTCQGCPEFSLSLEGSTARSDCHCEFGYYTNNIGTPESSCSKCAAGTFNDRLNQETCSKCPAGKFSEVDTATSAETCKICQAGFSADGQAQCDACPGNAATLEPGGKLLTDCKCNAGYSGADGRTCEHCGPGKYKGDRGSVACTNCLPDSYHSDYAREFQSDCNNCDPNAEAPEGSDSRDDCKCKVGWTSNIPDRDGESCVACSAGKFKDKIGYFACEDCEANTYVDTEASSSSAQCQRCFEFSESPAGSDSLDDCLCLGGYERATS